MKRHKHVYQYCDCRLHPATEGRDCCCVGGRACYPQDVCACGKRKP